MRIQSLNLLQIWIVLGLCCLTVPAEAQTDTTATVQADVILLGQTIQDTLAVLGEIKYYQLKVTEGVDVTLTLTTMGFDARLLLYRARSVAEVSETTQLNDVDEAEMVEEIARNLSTGTYIIGVAEFDNRGTGTFSLAVSTELLALFDFSGRYGRVPFTVNFNDLSPGASVWSWDFGDGATSTDKSVSHTYTQTGAYTVRLIVSNNASEIDTIEATIVVDLFEDGNVDAGDGTWVLDLDTMDGDQGKRVLDVEERQVFDVQVFAKRSFINAQNLIVDLLYDPEDIEPITNIQSESFPNGVDWFVDGGLARFTVNSTANVSVENGGVGEISFQVLPGFTGQTEIWFAGAQFSNNNSSQLDVPNSSVVIQNIVPVGPVVNVDCDGDGDVDFQDFLIFVGAFGSKTGEDRFMAACDYNSDGEISFPDFLIFASNFGRSSG